VVSHFHVPVHGTEQVQRTVQIKKTLHLKVLPAAACVNPDRQNQGVQHTRDIFCTDVRKRLQASSHPRKFHSGVVAADVHVRQCGVDVAEYAAACKESCDAKDQSHGKAF
jgi:hypothetical protein